MGPLVNLVPEPLQEADRRRPRGTVPGSDRHRYRWALWRKSCSHTWSVRPFCRHGLCFAFGLRRPPSLCHAATSSLRKEGRRHTWKWMPSNFYPVLLIRFVLRIFPHFQPNIPQSIGLSKLKHNILWFTRCNFCRSLPNPGESPRHSLTKMGPLWYTYTIKEGFSW